MHTIKKHPLSLAFIFLFPLFTLGQATKKSGVFFDTIRVEGRVGLAITMKDLPGQRFVLEIPEIFTLKGFKNGLYNYSEQVWKYDSKGAEMVFEDDKYKYSINLEAAKSKKSVGVKWDLSFKNKTVASLYDLAAFNCWTMNAAPLFKDLRMDRTFVHDSLGKKVLLKDVSKNQGTGKRTMQFYSSVEGIDLSQTPWISQWAVISDQTLSGRVVSIVSTDAKWIYENRVNGRVAYFFNNWEHDHGCLHASPLLARELKPGKIAKASGEFKFTQVQ